MAKKGSYGGIFLLQLALGVFFIAIGLLGLMSRGGAGDLYGVNAGGVFSGDVARVINIVLNIIYLLCGIALIISLFTQVKLVGLAMLIVCILWIISIVMRHFLGGFNFKGFEGFLSWLVPLCRDIVFGFGLWVCKDRN